MSRGREVQDVMPYKYKAKKLKYGRQWNKIQEEEQNSDISNMHHNCQVEIEARLNRIFGLQYLIFVKIILIL